MKKIIFIISTSLLIVIFAVVLWSVFLAKNSNTMISNEQPSFTKYFDLNGDGTKEEINLFLTKNEITGSISTLGIDSTFVEVPGHNPVGNFQIVDIKNNDAIHEIAITDQGPSTDFTTSFYSFTNGHWNTLGTIPGDIKDMTFPGDGSVTTLARGQILDTWFYHETFVLSSQGLLMAAPATYFTRVSPTDQVRLLVSLQIADESKKDSVNRVVRAGSKGLILGCDNVSWCQIKFTDGLTGWFEVTNGTIITSVNLPMEQVFDGLSTAD